ncbi:hypothetical protein HK436_16030 [Mesorhizobium sediminum]|nr:hypothetical protein [Mesorhizobium sediminum]
MQTRGGHQSFKSISESGLYKLIMRSDKPEAKAFQRAVGARTGSPEWSFRPPQGRRVHRRGGEGLDRQ